MERGGGSTKTGWFYHRARYYSPLVRRYVQEDPIGYGGGTNLYAYVDGRPLEAIDPNGTAAQSPDDARVAGGGGLSLRIGAGSGSVRIDGVAISGGAAFLAGSGFMPASNSGFYSIHSNVPRGSVFQSDRTARPSNAQLQRQLTLYIHSEEFKSRPDYYRKQNQVDQRGLKYNFNMKRLSPQKGWDWMGIDFYGGTIGISYSYYAGGTVPKTASLTVDATGIVAWYFGWGKFDARLPKPAKPGL